jgi:hypothetical protein
VGGPGTNNVIGYPNIYEVLGNKSSAGVSKIKASLSTWAKDQAEDSGYSTAALEKIFKIQADLIVKNKGAWIVSPRRKD